MHSPLGRKRKKQNTLSISITGAGSEPKYSSRSHKENLVLVMTCMSVSTQKKTQPFEKSLFYFATWKLNSSLWFFSTHILCGYVDEKKGLSHRALSDHWFLFIMAFQCLAGSCLTSQPSRDGRRPPSLSKYSLWKGAFLFYLSTKVL